LNVDIFSVPDDVEKPVIDYDKLKMLCNIKGLKDKWVIVANLNLWFDVTMA